MKEVVFLHILKEGDRTELVDNNGRVLIDADGAVLVSGDEYAYAVASAVARSRKELVTVAKIALLVNIEHFPRIKQDPKDPGKPLTALYAYIAKAADLTQLEEISNLFFDMKAQLFIQHANLDEATQVLAYVDNALAKIEMKRKFLEASLKEKHIVQMVDVEVDASHATVEKAYNTNA